MRLTDLSLDLLEVPLRDTLTTAAGERATLRFGLLSLRTDTGSTGLGEVAFERTADAQMMTAALADGLAGGLAERLAAPIARVELGDERAVVAGSTTMLEVGAQETASLDRALRSARATAVADLRAHARGLPLAAVLMTRPASGRPSASVAVNALLGIGDASIVAAEARRLVDAGFGCLKLKGGAEAPGAILRRVAAVRESVGPSVALRLDLNGAFDEEAAAGLLHRVLSYDLEYVEQPIPAAAGVAALARLRRRAGIPIAADESLTDPAAAESLTRAAAADVLVVKPSRVGGPDEASRIVDIALAAGVGITVACLLESGVGVAAALHLAATVPGDVAHGLSTAAWLACDMLARPLGMHAGRLSVPTAPGLGIALDPASLGRYRVAAGVWHA